MGQKIILLLDSNPTIQKIVGLTFTSTEYQVISLNVNLSSVEDALEKIHNISPNMVLLDLDLPGIGGKNICRRLKNDPSLAHLPVILLVRELDRYSLEKLQESYGPDRILGKPFETSDLIRVVEECFDPSKRQGDTDSVHPSGLSGMESWLRQIIEEKVEDFVRGHLEEIIAERVDRFLQSDSGIRQFREIFSSGEDEISQRFMDNSKSIIESVARKVVPEQARVVIQREIDRIKSGG
ncbi:MAG: response regulator [bacterium]